MKTIRDILARLLPHRQPSAGRWRQPLLALAIGLAACAATAQPANDNFANATVLTGLTGTTNGDNTLATLEPCETNTVNTDDYGPELITNSVWYAWTAPASGVLQLNTDDTNLLDLNLDFVLSVWTDTNATPSMCDGSLVNVVSDDQSQTDTNSFYLYSSVTMQVVAGTTYYFEVSSWNDLSSPFDNAGPYQLNWQIIPPPANDDFVNATVISGLTGTNFGSNLGATLETGEPTSIITDDDSYGVSVAASVWYVWTAPASGNATFDTIGSDFDTVLAAYNGNSVANLTLITADDDIDYTVGNVQSRITFYATQGTTYFLQVCGSTAGTSDQGNVELNWTETTPGFSAGQFRFTSTSYNVSQRESIPAQGGGGMSATSGARVSVTRVGGAAGKVEVAYTVTNTSVPLVEHQNTTIEVDVNSNLVTGVFTNTYTTNIDVFVVPQFQATNVCSDSNVTYVQINANGTWGPITSPLFPPVFPTNNFSVVVTNADGTSNLLSITVSKLRSFVTNYYQAAIPFNQKNPSAAWDYIPKSGILTFNDFEMTKDIFVTLGSNNIFGNLPVSYPQAPVQVQVTLNSAVLDTNELSTIPAPTLDATRTNATLNVFSIYQLGYAMNFGFNSLCPGSDSVYATNVMNFERSTLRVNREAGTARIAVYRAYIGGNQYSGYADYSQASTIYYSIDAANAFDDWNTFTLQSGSDYAIPDVATKPVPEGVVDFTNPVGNWGSLNFPANAGTASRVQYITIPINNNNTVEFNKDIHIMFDGDSSHQWSQAVPGEINECTVTILFDKQPAGAVDRTYNVNNSTGTFPPLDQLPGANDTVWALAVQPADGSAIIAGDFTAYNETNANRIVRALPNGQFDVPFIINNGLGADQTVRAVALDSVGGIFIGGDFASFNGTQRNGIARLNPDGSLDNVGFLPGFGAGGNNSSSVKAIAVQPNGQILIAGDFTTYNNTNRNCIARLNPDGSVDSSFDPGIGPIDDLFPWLTAINSIALQPDGRIVIGGDFSSLDNIGRNYIARLNADGSLDTTFDPGEGANDIVYSVAVDTNNLILAAGAFTQLGALGGSQAISRLNADGSLDTSFGVGIGANDKIYTMALQPDGGILLGGVFTSVNQTRRVSIARLNPDGTVDTGFMDTAYNQFAGLTRPYYSPDMNAPNPVYALAVEPDGNVLIGGIFNQVGGGNSRVDMMPRQNVAQLIGGSTPGPGNISMGYGTYSTTGQNTNSTATITVDRINGTLGPAIATLQPVSLHAGAGAATYGVDYLFSPTTIIYGTTWANSWMLSDGVAGADYAPTVTILSSTNSSSTVDLQLTQPVGSDIFFLGGNNVPTSKGVLNPNYTEQDGENIPLGVALGQSLSPLNIIRDNIHPGVLSFSTTFYSTNENAGRAFISVVRTGGSDDAVTVKYQTVDGTAKAGVDYTATSGKLTFPAGTAAGATNQVFSIPIIPTSVNHPDRTFYVQLYSPGLGAGATALPTLGTTNALFEIININNVAGDVIFAGGTAVTIGTTNVMTYGTNENQHAAQITVLREGGTTGQLSVSVASTDGTAVNGVNYTGFTNQLTWTNGGGGPKIISMPIRQDFVVTPNLTVNLQLVNLTVSGKVNTNAWGAITNAIVTITNVDEPGALQFSSAAYVVNDVAGQALIPVVRTGGTAGTISATFATVDGTAHANTDYYATNNVITFTNGQISQTLRVPIIPDSAAAPNLSFSLVLTNASPTNALGSPNVATITIANSQNNNEPPGSPDPSYGGGLNGPVYALALEPSDGKLIVGGNFTYADGVPRQRIARLNTDGTLDTLFSSYLTTAGASDIVRSVAVQTDGRILVGGLFTNFNGAAYHRIVRLNYNGSIDTTFNPGSGADNAVYTMAQGFVSGTPVIYVGGSFATMNGAAHNAVVRLNAGGTVDPGFNPGTGPNGTVYALALQTDGKVVIGGDFTAVNGVTNCSHVARLNVDGSVDTTFNLGSGADNSVHSLAVQLDGGILIGGLFTHVNGTSQNAIARLNTDGSIDPGFAAAPGANADVQSITLQTDTRIILGGTFTLCNGVTRNYLTRLNPDGTVDPTINFGMGPDNFVAASVIQPDAKIIIGGGFLNYQGVSHPYLARIYGGSMTGSGTLQFFSGNYQVQENGTNALITVIRTGGTSGTNTDGSGHIYVSYYTYPGTAVDPTNYTDVSGQLDFPMGETVRSFLVPVRDDGVLAPTLTVNLVLTNATPPAVVDIQPTATLSIINDDSTLSLSLANYSVPKNVINGVAPISVYRQGGTNGTATVLFTTTTNGTATTPLDFTPVTTLVTFPPGLTNVVVNIPINNNGLPEGNQTVTMLLTNVTGAALVSPTNATLTIIDNVNAPGQLSFASPAYTVTEGGGVGTTELDVTVQRTAGSFGTITVNFQTQDGTATQPGKYLSTNGILQFADGETSKTFPVQVVNTATAEGPEFFSIYLYNPTGNATLASPSNTVVTILNTNIGIAFASAANAFTEPAGLVPGTVLLNVVRFNNTNGVTTVNYSTTNGTAFANTNFYGVTNGLLTFNPGEAVKTIALTTLHDTNVTGDLSFTVGLANPSGSAQLTSPSYTLVTDHDADAGLSFLTNATGVYRNAGYAIILVTNTNPNVEPVSVNYATGGGSAVPGLDYTAVSGTLAFTNGAVLNYFLVPILLNNSVQTNRMFNVTLSSPTPPGVLFPASLATEVVTIIGTNTPAGLSFSTPVILGGQWGSTNLDNTFGAPELGDPSIAGAGANAPVWFAWTAPPGGNGEVTLDTIGSVGTNGVQLDTVLAVFTGSSLSSLNQVAANDDLYPSYPFTQQNETLQNIWNTNQLFRPNGRSFVPPSSFIPVRNLITQPFSGPSGLRFTAQAGTTYYFAADTKVSTSSSTFSTTTSPLRGVIQLNWAYHPAGVFRFATEDVDNTGITDTNGNPMLLYQCAESEGSLSAADLVNNNGNLHREVGPFEANHQYRTTVQAYYYYDVEGLLVTVTRVAGSTGRMLVDYSTQDGDTNLIVNGDVPAVGLVTNLTFTGLGYQTNITTQDYVPVSGTLIFDDFEMSKTIRIPIVDDANSASGLGSGRISAGIPQPNRDFMVVLSNPRRDPAESSAVSAPRVDPIFGKVLCRILDCDIDPQGPSTSQIVVSNAITGLLFTNYSFTDPFGQLLTPTNAIFNFAKANYRVPRDVQNFFNGTPVTVYVNRGGTNRASVTVHYRFDSYPLDNNTVDDANNEFPLQPASDYATPTPATTADILGTNSDFAGVGGDSGTLTFPGGTSNPFQSQPIHFTVNDNQITEFNKDIHLTIYELDSNNNPFQPGMVAETTVTILFDDSAPPAGSVDEYYNPDLASSMALLVTPLDFNSTVANPGADKTVYAVAWLTNNESIIGGAFNSYSDSTNSSHLVHGIARLYPNGELDPNFNPGVGINVGDNVSYIQSLALTPDNKIVIGGTFTSYNNQSRNYLARVNADGSLDATFAVGSGFNGMVWSVLVQPNGQVLAGGNFTSYAGTPCNYIVRLNTDGSLDTTFNVSNLLSGPVKAMALTPQGGVVIGGLFAVTGHSYANIARLNSDGSLDTTFGPGTGANGAVLAVACQPDNKVILGGSFTSISGVAFNNLARLNPDGTIDGTYNNGTGTDNQVVSLTLDPASTNLYVGGSFTVMNGTHRLGFARLYPDGTVDTTFLDTAYNQYAGLPRVFYGDPPGTVNASALQGDGNVLIGGSFQEVGGGQADGNVRYLLEGERGLYPSTYDTNLWVAYGGGQDGNLEPKTRDGVRNRSNIARLIGGATPGPGNLGMVSSSYAANKNQYFEPVTLVRANGLLGYASANFAVLPGLAKSGLDYAYRSAAPLYPLAWEYQEAGIQPTRMHSDGFEGADGLMQNFFGWLWKPGLNGPASVNVTIFNDTASSGNLSATFQMANPSGADLFYLGGQDIPVGVALGESAAPFTVVDNTREDGVFGFAASSYVASNSPVTITISRTNGSSGAVQMSYQTVLSGSTAVANVDYTPVNGYLTIPAAQTTGSFPLTILNNSSISAQEKTVNVQLFNLQDLSGGNAQFGLTNAVVRIINPNYPGFLNFNANDYYVNLSAGVVNLTVTRSVGSKGTATVQYRTADLTARNGVNYAGSTNTLTWNSGDVSPRTVSIPLININQTGPVLLFTANLFNPTLNGTNAPGLLGATTSATIFIINDDTYGTFQFSSPSYQYNDGSNALATLTVVRSGSALGTNVTVNYATADGTALAGVNYVATNGSLTFTNGQLTRSFTVRLLDDGSTNDPSPANFYFQANLSNPSAGAYLNPSFTNTVVHLVHREQYNEPSGSVDPSYTASANASVLALALQSDGQVVAGGSFTVADGTSRNHLARFNLDGTLDDTFLDGLSGADNTVNAVVSQTDDRILVGGAFDLFDGVNNQHIVRLMTDGSLDTSFSPGSAADNTVFALAESFINGGRVIYVGGAFANFENVVSPGVVRLDNSGAVDASFNVGGGVFGTVYALAVYPTNSIYFAGDVLVGGAFTNFNGTVVGNLVRLNPDGSLDTNFNQNALANGPVRAIAIQLDGSVLIGGEFTNVNHTVVNNLARLTPAGALDTAFTAAAAPGVNGEVNTIVLQQDNRIVVGGQFNYGNGVTRNDLTRLLPTGVVDPTINFGTGANGAVNAVVIQPADGNLVIGGGFTQFNGQSCDHIARLFGGSELGSGAFQFTSASYQIDENGSFASITIERTGGTSGTNADGSGNVYVAFATADGSAKAGTNYTYTTNYVAFPAGEVLETLYVPVQDDGVITTNLTVNLSLSNPSPGASLGDQASAVLTIINDDSAVMFAQPNYPLQITANGFANIPIVRYGSASGSCTVNFATTTNGTAVIGTDYYPTNASVVFPPGVLTNIVQVPVLYDTNVFGATVTMMLTNALNTVLASPSNAVLNLSESSPYPGNLFFAATNYGVYANAGVALLPVLRTNGSAGSVSVYYTTVPITAVPGVDYTPVTNELQFSDQDTLGYCRIPVINNLLAQTPVSLQVYLFNPSGASLITPTNTILVISNNTAVFAFTLGTNTVAEGQGPASIVVQRFNNSSIVSSVHYTTTAATNLAPGISNAVAGYNYTTTAGTLTFNVGETLKSISVPVFNRSNYVTEAFGMNLSSPTNGQLVAPSNSVVFITPSAAGVSFTTNAATVLNNAGYLAVPVLCSNPGIEPANGTPLAVNYTTVDGSAKAGYNYNAISGTLLFTNGLVTNTIYVPILNAQFLSSNLTFSVILTNVTAPGVLAPYATQTVAIVEGLAGVSFSQANYNVPKNSGFATITVNRSGFTNSFASVDYFVTNGSAIGGQNFYPTNGTLVFTNGVTSQAFTVALIANTLVQPNLLALMGLLNATNAQIINPGDATLTILETGSSYVIPAGAQLVTNYTSRYDYTNDVIGSNDTVNVLFAFRDAAGQNVNNLVAVLLATNGVTAPNPVAQSYGPLTVYGHSVSKAFTFTAQSTNTFTISPTFQLFDSNTVTHIGTSIGPATFVFTVGVWTTMFANTNPIVINDGAAASPYPSIINVSGVGNTLIKATVTLTNLSHQDLSDVAALVVSPSTNTLIMSGVGTGFKAAHLNLTFDDAATNSLPQNGTVVSGTNKPTQNSTPYRFP